MHIFDYISEPIKSLKPHKQNLFTQMFKKAFRVHPLLPVVRCGEGCHDDVLPIDVDDVRHGLQDVEVEVRVARDGAVQAGLEEGGPLLLQDTWRAAAVVLTHPGHPRKHHLDTTTTSSQRCLPSPYCTMANKCTGLKHPPLFSTQNMANMLPTMHLFSI